MGVETHRKQRSERQIKAWVAQNHTIYGSLIAVSLLMLQPFLFRGEASGVSAKICVISFALAIPILAALSLLSYEEDYRTRMVSSYPINIAKVIGEDAALVGFVAGFWHISALAGICVLASGIIGTLAYTFGYKKLYTYRGDKGRTF